jgi:hypothetical protein
MQSNPPFLEAELSAVELHLHTRLMTMESQLEQLTALLMQNNPALNRKFASLLEQSNRGDRLSHELAALKRMDDQCPHEGLQKTPSSLYQEQQDAVRHLTNVIALLLPTTVDGTPHPWGIPRRQFFHSELPILTPEFRDGITEDTLGWEDTGREDAQRITPLVILTNKDNNTRMVINGITGEWWFLRQEENLSYQHRSPAYASGFDLVGTRLQALLLAQVPQPDRNAIKRMLKATEEETVKLRVILQSLFELPPGEAKSQSSGQNQAYGLAHVRIQHTGPKVLGVIVGVDTREENGPPYFFSSLHPDVYLRQTGYNKYHREPIGALPPQVLNRVIHWLMDAKKQLTPKATKSKD